MTFLAHAYMGATAYHAVFGGHAVAPLLGAALGAAPDLLDFAVRRWYPKWWLKDFIHSSRTLFWIQILLVAPGLHMLFDRLIHDPVIPERSSEMDATLFVWSFVFTVPVRRRDVLWLTGEALVWTCGTILWMAT